MQGLIDMHCHIVPGVDDGARDLYDAAKILQLEYRNQVQAVIVTPHYRAGMFETPQREIERQFQRIDEMTRRSRSGMRVYLGCEEGRHRAEHPRGAAGRVRVHADRRRAYQQQGKRHQYAPYLGL